MKQCYTVEMGLLTKSLSQFSFIRKFTVAYIRTCCWFYVDFSSVRNVTAWQRDNFANPETKYVENIES